MCIQLLRPNATGRIEFSARLLLSSSSGYSRNRASFLHSVSCARAVVTWIDTSVRAYWQALLSALEGNATDCAASSIVLLTAAVVASMLPAARAARVDVNQALRSE